MDDLNNLSAITILRCILPSDKLSDAFGMPTTHFHRCISVTIIVPYGYSTVTHLRIVAQNGTTFCSFMMGKSYPVPSKFISISISILQLFAGTMASKVDALLRHNLNNVVADSISWTHSMLVLLMVNNYSKCFSVLSIIVWHR